MNSLSVSSLGSRRTSCRNPTTTSMPLSPFCTSFAQLIDITQQRHTKSNGCIQHCYSAFTENEMIKRREFFGFEMEQNSQYLSPNGGLFASLQLFAARFVDYSFLAHAHTTSTLFHTNRVLWSLCWSESTNEGANAKQSYSLSTMKLTIATSSCRLSNYFTDFL